MENEIRRVESSSHKRFYKPSILCLIIFIFSCLLYANTINHEFAYDDFPFIVNNEFVQDGISGIPKILSSSYWDGNTSLHNVNYFSYRPIPAISFALETSLFNGQPFARHLIQVLLYAILCSLLFVLLKYLFPNHQPFALLIVCLLFAAHPLHTEIVANLKNRDELLGLLLAIIGLIFLFGKNNNFIKYIGSFFFILLAILSKETSIILIVACLAFSFIKNLRKPKAALLNCLPLIACLFIYFAIRLSMGGGNIIKFDPFDNPILFAESSGEILATKIWVLGKMQQLLWLPISLQYEYGFAEIVPTNFSNPLVHLSLLIHLILLGGLYYFRKNNLAVFAILLYFVTVAVIGNILYTFPVALAERFLFIPSLYICLLPAAIFMKFSEGSFKTYKIALLVLAAVLILFSFKTVKRNPVWKNNNTLFSHDVKVSDQSARANMHYGQLLLNEAKMKKSIDKPKVNLAIKYLNKAKNLKPNRWVTEINLALINAYKLNGQKEKAISLIRKGLEFDPSIPQLLLAETEILIQQNEFKKANEVLDKILKQSPNSYQAHWFKGFIAGSLGNLNEAIKWLEKAYQLNPNSKDVLKYLSKAYQESGNDKMFRKYSKLLKAL